jgi:hypothetical protein
MKSGSPPADTSDEPLPITWIPTARFVSRQTIAAAHFADGPFPADGDQYL